MANTTSGAEVISIMDNLKQIILSGNSDLTPVIADSSVKDLYTDLQTLKMFMRKLTEDLNDEELLEKTMTRIRELVREAEDTIETSIFEEYKQITRSGLDKVVHMVEHKSGKRNLEKKMSEIGSKVKDAYETSFPLTSQKSASTTRSMNRSKRVPVDDKVIGREEELEQIVDKLVRGTEELEVVSLTGMLGLGKTALVRKVFSHPSIEYHFFTRIFVAVSQDYKRKEVLLQILRCIGYDTPKILEMPETELSEQIHQALKGCRFLVVLDDVWTREAWDSLKVIFPWEDKKGSRVLVTTEQNNVARSCSRTAGCVHHLRFLYEDEGKELLRSKVFDMNQLPEKLESFEAEILRKCSGLPLAIVIVAGELRNHPDDLHWWEKIAKGFIATGGKPQMKDVIRFSFNQLPQLLKLCFLYFGVFREDSDIPTRTLVQLWMAEGLVQEASGVCLEDVAEQYLDELVDRNLVMVEKRRKDGRFKTCRIHDIFSEFCKEEAMKENIFQVLTSDQHSLSSDSRRISIDYNVGEFFRSMPKAKCVRSVLSLRRNEFDSPSAGYMSSILTTFKLLKVLDVRAIRLQSFPVDLCYLFLLRYLAISGSLKTVPEKLSNLRNLQTLIILTTLRTVQFDADISKLPLLRHLRCNSSLSLQRTKREPSANGNLQTLSITSVESWGDEMVEMCPKLKKLGISGNLSSISDGNWFKCLLRLYNLENLKLLHDNNECKVMDLPQENMLPRKLTKLTLSNTFLDWKYMSTLGKLEYLEVLKLKNNAFGGGFWKTEDGDFQRLKVLQISGTDLFTWKASANHFPELHSLYFADCTKLQSLPHALAYMARLRNVEVYCCNSMLAASAKKLMLLKVEQGQVFNVSIYPPEI